VGAVFIADDGEHRNLAVAPHSSLIVGFAQESVHPLDDALCFGHGWSACILFGEKPYKIRNLLLS
jgi:hypothetical protein